MDNRVLADWIGRRLKRLAGGGARHIGMTQKNRRRLAVFRDPKQIRDLILLPDKLLKRAESGSLPPKEAATLVRAAVAVELELMCPVRLQNLSEINVDTDFVRSHSGKDAAVHLFIPGNRTKNGEDIELELPKRSMALIDVYLAKYRNELIKPECRGRGPRFLFPKPDGTVKVGKVLADGICRVLRRELGIEFNVHLFRHLGCYLYLKAHPGQIDVMRRVLGHKDGMTTMRFYAFIEQSDAFRMFDTHILQIRDEALRPRRRTAMARKGAAR
jgi:integrase